MQAIFLDLDFASPNISKGQTGKCKWIRKNILRLIAYILEIRIPSSGHKIYEWQHTECLHEALPFRSKTQIQGELHNVWYIWLQKCFSCLIRMDNRYNRIFNSYSGEKAINKKKTVITLTYRLMCSKIPFRSF